jgi:hypothetical protein
VSDYAWHGDGPNLNVEDQRAFAHLGSHRVDQKLARSLFRVQSVHANGDHDGRQ